MLKRIDHVGIVVDDLESAGRLLRDVLGMTLVRSVEIPERQLHAAFYRCGETNIELIQVSAEIKAKGVGQHDRHPKHHAADGCAGAAFTTRVREPAEIDNRSD